MIKYHHNYFSQFICRDCLHGKSYKSYRYAGWCKTQNKKIHNTKIACKYFIPKNPCPECVTHPVNEDDILGICKICRGEIQSDKQRAYT